MAYEVKDRQSGFIAWYEKLGKSGDEYFRVNCIGLLRVPKLIIDHNIKFEDIPKNKGDVFFTSYEECVAYCRYLSPERETQGYLYQMDGSIMMDGSIIEQEVEEQCKWPKCKWPIKR